MVSTSAESKNNLRPALLLVGGIVLLLIIFLGILAILISTKSKEQVSNTGITEEDISIITEGLSFTDQGSDSFVYQSPIYNFEVKINTNRNEFSETTRGLSIYSKNFKDNTHTIVYVEVPYSASYKFDLQKELENFKKYVSSFDEGKVVSSEEKTLGGEKAYVIDYSRKSFSGDKIVGLAVLSVKDNQLYKIESTTEAENNSAIKADFDSYVNGFKFIDSAQVEASANYASTLWGYEFKYDTRYWQLDSSSDRSVYLQPRRTDYSIAKPEIEMNITSSEVSRFDLLGKELAFLGEQVEERIKSLEKQTSSYPGLKINKKEIVDVAGRKGMILEFTVNPEKSYAYENYKEYWILHFNALTRITVNYSNKQQDEILSKSAEVVNAFKVKEPTAGQVKGVTSESTEEEKVALQAKPAVVRIYSRSCGEVNIPFDAQLPSTSGKKYEMCIGGTGSGFFVNSDGYVATNGHVVVYDSYELIYNSLYSGQSLELLINIFRDIYEDAYLASYPQLGSSLSREQVIQILSDNPSVRKEIAMNMAQILTGGTNKDAFKQVQTIYVQKGSNPFVIKSGQLSNAADHYKAQLIGYDYEPTDDLTNEKASDVALLKLEVTGDYPTLSLYGENIQNLNIGSSLLVMGFPGVATDILFVEESSRGEETVTRGIVSALKESTGGRYLIQTDASIQSGNSGGPGIDKGGFVIGLATYGLNETGAADFNFLRSISDLTALMQKNGVQNKIGKTETKWREGVSLFWEGKFSAAVKSLESAATNYPDLIETQSLIRVANNKIAQGLDKSGTEDITDGGFDIQKFIENLSDTEKVLFAVVSGLLCFVLIMFFMLMAVMRRLSKKNAQLQTYTAIPTQTVNTGM